MQFPASFWITVILATIGLGMLIGLTLANSIIKKTDILSPNTDYGLYALKLIGALFTFLLGAIAFIIWLITSNL